MDIARPDLARKKRLRHSLYSVSALIVVALVTVGVSRLEPAAPRVDRDTIYLDTVQRGPMVRQVRGTGTLVPERIRWIPATTDGTVDRIVIRPGALVAPDTVILELSNPELEQSTLEARLNLEAAEARYGNRQVEVERDLLDQRATLATTEAQLKTARLQAAADGQLFTQGLVASFAAPAVAVGRAGVRDALRARAGTAADGHRHRRGAARGGAGRGGPPADALRAAAAADGRPARAGRDARRVAAGAARRRAAHHHRDQPGPGGRPDGAQGRAAHRGDAGQGRPDRSVGRHRHPQRRHSGARHPHRSGRGERDGDGGRGARTARCRAARVRT